MIVSKQDLLKKDLKGKVVIFKTDTVYGIGALLNDADAVERIFEIKNRDKKNPLAVLVGHADDAYRLVHDPERIHPHVSEHWPGALTLVTKKSEAVSDAVTRGKKTVGIRMPDDTDALDILRCFGPMAVTSLNLSSEPPVLKYEDALKFEKVVDYVVEGDDLDSVASTVFDADEHRTLRQGAVVVNSKRL